MRAGQETEQEEARYMVESKVPGAMARFESKESLDKWMENKQAGEYWVYERVEWSAYSDAPKEASE